MCIRASDGDAMCTCDDEYGEDDDNGVDDDCDVGDDDGGGDAGDDSDGVIVSTTRFVVLTLMMGKMHVLMPR